jgi:uncharacterized OB-fold protein
MSGGSDMPVPVPTPESQPFWSAAREKRLVVPKCRSCGSTWFPPTLACPSCGAADHEWIEVSGRGTVFSFVVMHRVYHPAFADKVPYVVAVIELEEGPRLLSNLVGILPREVRCDMPVRVTFDERRGGVTIPQFTPAGAPQRGYGDAGQRPDRVST